MTNHELNRTVLSEHDSCSRPMRITHMEGDSHVYTGEVTYDAYNNLARFEETVGADRTAYSTAFSYDVENKPTLLKYNDSDSDKVAYTYDGLGRIEKRTITVGGNARETSYTYIAGEQGSGSTTDLTASISQTGGNFTYTYDDNGNITRVVQDNVATAYTYDALGQLIQVDDGQENATWVYAYDQGGNILSKRKYALGTTTGEPLESKTFTYGNANWKDQLTAVNGVGITYDQIGNPLNDGTWTYTWEKGRQLKQMQSVDTNASFVYNENGLRVQKTVNGEVTNYTLHGKNIVHMTQGSNELHFFYDTSNKPAIVDFNGTKYAYVHNLQGDIVAILDSNGNKVVEYKYDAWGKQISKTGSMASTLGTVQPFRYRGYVYDEETGMNYLRNRYYIHHSGRFLCTDSILRTGILQDNLHAYCVNQPITRLDLNGTDSESIDENHDPIYFTVIRNGKEYQYVKQYVPEQQVDYNWLSYAVDVGIAIAAMVSSVGTAVGIADFVAHSTKKTLGKVLTRTALTAAVTDSVALGMTIFDTSVGDLAVYGIDALLGENAKNGIYTIPAHWEIVQIGPTPCPLPPPTMIIPTPAPASGIMTDAAVVPCPTVTPGPLQPPTY